MSLKVKVGYGPGIGASAGLDTQGFWTIVDAAERLGWDSLWFSERVTGDVPDPMAAMAAVAGRTERMMFGPSVLVLPGRNPVLLAKELATIDFLSGGRLVCAFGLGSDFPPEHGIFGVDRSDRAAMTDEATELIRRLWTEDEVTFSGRFFSVEKLTLRPKPVQDDPCPDIWFGGHSRAAARRVGRLGTGWLPSFISTRDYPERVEEIKEVAAANGREIEWDHYGALVPYLPDPDAENVDFVRDVVARRRPELDVDELLPTGESERLREFLEGYVEAGATKFALVPVFAPDDWTEELARLREEVCVPLEAL